MPFPSPEDASGIWSMRDVCKHKEANAWPDGYLEVQYVVVGGGGGGGVMGGGGGGGGVRLNFQNYGAQITGAVWPYVEQYESRMFLRAGATYPVIVGGGGNSGQQYTPATNGGDSSFNGIVAFGGGGGGNYVTNTHYQSNRGKDGGCGGGGCAPYYAGGQSLHQWHGYKVPPKLNTERNVLSYATLSAFPNQTTVITSNPYSCIFRAMDTLKVYQWTGSQYLETIPNIVLTVPRLFNKTGGTTGAKGTGSLVGGGGGGAWNDAYSSTGGSGWGWRWENSSIYSTLYLGGGGGGGGHTSTTGGNGGAAGGGGSVTSGTAGRGVWYGNNSASELTTPTTKNGQVGADKIGGYGQPNRGGGGGGCSWANPPITAHGGSGVVIIRYFGTTQATGGLVAPESTIFDPDLLVTRGPAGPSNFTTHIFNSSGNFTVNSDAGQQPIVPWKV